MENKVTESLTERITRKFLTVNFWTPNLVLFCSEACDYVIKIASFGFGAFLAEKTKDFWDFSISSWRVSNNWN